MARKKRAQIMSQVFIFILAAALFILILTYGYKAIAGFSTRSEQVAFVEFQSELESSVKSISLDYGSVKKVELTLPATYTELCLVDLSMDPSETFEAIHPRMYEAWLDKTQNVFLTPMEETPMDIGDIYLGEEGYLCIELSGGTITLRMEGLGNRAGITQWQEAVSGTGQQ
jgi:hypothetical protein